MFTSHKQISPPSLVLKLKISEVSQKWIPKAVELKRIPTHKKCKCKKFCSQTRLVGEIYSSDVIMHRGYCILFCRFTLFKKSIHHKLKSYIKSIFNAIFCHHFWCFLCSSNVLSTILKNEEWLLRCYATKFATVRPINLPMKKRHMSINILQCTLC